MYTTLPNPPKRLADVAAYGQHQQALVRLHLKCGAQAATDKELGVVNHQEQCQQTDHTHLKQLIQ
jgi:hypothetical protein